MPYVDQEARQRLDAGHSPQNPGELNYLIARTIDRYLSHYSRLTYTIINEVVGVLESVKQEFYRRIASPYEEQKREKNGDVFEKTPPP